MLYLLKRGQYGRTMLLMIGCAGFLAGLVLARRHVVVNGLIALLCALFTIVCLRFQSAVSLIILVICTVAIGTWRGGSFLHKLQPYHDLALWQVTFTATADADGIYAKQSQLSFTVRNVQFTKPQQQRVPGIVKVSGFGEVMVYRGDRIQVTGKLYPTRGANQATVAYAQIHTLHSSSSSVDALRRKFTSGMQTALPEPLASFGMGLLIGQRNTLPPELTQALLMVGLTHIIAVSGYNLTILLEAARRLLNGTSKLLSTLLALALIAGFLLVAGTSASIVRAAVISVLGLLAWYYGRTIRPVLLILLAAAGTAYANPVYLWADIGWYLSFLAFFGILVIGPMITRLICRERQPPLLLQIVIESLCAELMTIPLVLYIFGQFSLVSLVANMLVVALIPLAMLCSFVAGLAGMLAGNVAGWLAWPAQVLLTYMLDVVGMLSRIPHVFQQNKYASAVDMAAFYSVLVGLLLFGYWRQKRRPWHQMAPNIRNAVIKPTGNG